MTHTAEPMTLTQVRNDIREIEACGGGLTGKGALKQWADAIDAELAKQREAEPVAPNRVRELIAEIKTYFLGSYTASISEAVDEATKAFDELEQSRQLESDPIGEVCGYVPHERGGKCYAIEFYGDSLPYGTKLYTHPQQRDAAEVSDNELPGMWSSTDVTGGDPDERCYAERNAVEVTDEMVRIAQKAYKNAFGKSQAGALRAALNAVLSAVASRDREDTEHWRKLVEIANDSGEMDGRYWVDFPCNFNAENLTVAIDARRKNKP